MADVQVTASPVKEIDWRDEKLAVWEVRILAVILVATLVGNGLVLLAIYIRRCRGRKQRLTRMHFFIMHLSVADLLNGLLNVLPQMAWDITFRFQGGPILCKIIKFGQPLGYYLSSYILIATAIDRYHAICFPLSYCKTTSRRSRITVYCAWILSLLFCVPQLLFFSYQEVNKNVWDCWAEFPFPYVEKAYVTWFSATVFALPFCALAFTYTEICCSIWRSREVMAMAGLEAQQRALAARSRNRSTLISKAKISTIKQTLAVVMLYAITSTPFVGSELWAVWDPAAGESDFANGPIFTILSLLSSLTSCVNPWIYLSFSHELRVALIKFFMRGTIKGGHFAGFGRRSSNGNSMETRSSKRSSLMSRMSRYTSLIVYRSYGTERQGK